MARIKAGKFEMNIWYDGHPVWNHLIYNGKEIASLHHNELSDLEYLIKKAIQVTKNVLPEGYKNEV